MNGVRSASGPRANASALASRSCSPWNRSSARAPARSGKPPRPRHHRRDDARRPRPAPSTTRAGRSPTSAELAQRDVDDGDDQRRTERPRTHTKHTTRAGCVARLARQADESARCLARWCVIRPAGCDSDGDAAKFPRWLACPSKCSKRGPAPPLPGRSIPGSALRPRGVPGTFGRRRAVRPRLSVRTVSERAPPTRPPAATNASTRAGTTRPHADGGPDRDGGAAAATMGAGAGVGGEPAEASGDSTTAPRRRAAWRRGWRGRSAGRGPRRWGRRPGTRRRTRAPPPRSGGCRRAVAGRLAENRVDRVACCARFTVRSSAPFHRSSSDASCSQPALTSTCARTTSASSAAVMRAALALRARAPARSPSSSGSGRSGRSDDSGGMCGLRIARRSSYSSFWCFPNGDAPVASRQARSAAA